MSGCSEVQTGGRFRIFILHIELLLTLYHRGENCMQKHNVTVNHRCDLYDVFLDQCTDGLIIFGLNHMCIQFIFPPVL